MKIRIVAGIAVAALALTGCGADDGQISDIASQAASAAVLAFRAKPVKAVDALTGPVCEGLDQADQSLASLAAGKADTVGQASSRSPTAQSNLEQAAQRCPGRVAGRALQCFDGAGRTDAVAGFALKDDAAVPESIATASESVDRRSRRRRIPGLLVSSQLIVGRPSPGRSAAEEFGDRGEVFRRRRSALGDGANPLQGAVALSWNQRRACRSHPP